jgi:MoaA/NifB/PqqE/SkfB family radical SAM enzyme
MNQRHVATKLLANGFRYRYLRLTGKASRLQAISLEITHRCICRCSMCNIWRIPNEVADLDLSVWTGLLASPELRGLRELDITGGEPFLREDLPELLHWICRAHPGHFPGLRTVAITTNGILTDRILRTVREIIGPMQELGIDLVLACGMDAVGDQHDRIRNFRGAWDKLSATLADLVALRIDHPNLVLGIKTTIVPQNVNELQRIAGFARERDLFTIISPCIITANRFGNTDLADSLTFDAAALQTMQRFYQGPEFAWDGHRQTMLGYLATGRVKKPCSAGFNTVFVRHSGEVFPCPLIPVALGNIRLTTLAELLSGAKAARFRRGIGTFAECRVCTEPGLERLAWPFEGFTCLRRLIQLGAGDFARLAGHMGLDKYL